ncbi:MAG: SprB repeat-containing protein [Bacteroidia bacterium]|nr:SprB repeat-containing protein [Bacteroidia bacterium]
MKKHFAFLLSLVLFAHFSYSQCQVNASFTNATCGACNGAVWLSFSGGMPPYYVNFNGTPLGSPNGSPLTIPNLCPGTYGFSVTDANMVICNGAVNVNVSNFGQPLVTTLTYTNPSCPTCTDGSITVNTSGGFFPYFYQWNTGATTPGISGLGTGIYTVCVTDTIGCTSCDTISISYNGSNVYPISGTAFYDLNNDGLYNSPDIPLAQQQIQLLPSGLITYTNSNGGYLFGESSGNYTVSYVPDTTYVISNGVNSHPVVLTTTGVSGLDFSLQPDSLFHALRVYSYSPLPRCSTNSAFYTTVTNDGTYIDSGQVAFTFDPSMIYVNSIPAGTLNLQTITFTFDSLLPFETRVFQSNFLMPGPGTNISTSTYGALYDSGSNVLDADSSIYARVILCSYDPNDKQVDPEGDGPSHRVDMDTELRYMIRFQNTGNDTAFSILITDTLDAGLDPNSAFVIATSHPCWIQKVNGNVMKFWFDNILLPDSTTNEPESHGYVLFRVKGNLSNPDPTVVNNTAFIFFDQNPPIQTNVAMNTFSNSTTGMNEWAKAVGSIRVTPNPMRGEALVAFDGVPENGHTLRMTDALGRNAVSEKHFRGTSYLLEREHLSPGLYLLRISDDDSEKVYHSRLLVY